MVVLGIVAVLTYTFGAYAYGAVVWLSLQDAGTRGWAGQRRADPTEAEVVGLAMMVVGFVWFLLNLADAVLRLGPPIDHSWLQVGVLWLAFLYPPLIMHVTVAEVAAGDLERCEGLGAWRWASRLAYVPGLAIPLWATLAFMKAVPATESQLAVVLNGGLTVTFVGASVFSVLMSKRFGSSRRTSRDRLGDRAMTAMFLVTVLLFVLMPAIAVATQASLGAVLGRSVEIAARSLPLAFLFVGAYFESRFEFFDVLVKRGATLLVTLAALVVFFAALLPLLARFEGRGTSPLVYAITLLPIALALPPAHTKISAALDRWWLGRRFAVVDAVTHFISALRAATSEQQLVTLAEQSLGEIFAAPVKVRIRGDAMPDFAVMQEAPIRAAGGEGAILMGPRASDAPYFSGDLALVASLADVLAAVVDNLHLQARKREQEQLAHQLSLHASRSELKALRAQINPHFLFNALNAIAGLIHRHPDRADRTIEQLADVFRYALRGAESEWAVLEDEVEFVRAYLEVERARFGERLQVDIQVAPEVRTARIPTMMVQTLVENAVKHGLSDLLGPAVVGVHASRHDDRVVVAVTDNGEGFNARPVRRPADRRSGGYGLANIRQRLEGYFGPAAALTIERDQAAALTVVAVELPFLRETPAGEPALETR